MSVRLFTFDAVQVANLRYTKPQFLTPQQKQPIDRTYPVVNNVVVRNQPKVPQPVAYRIRENLLGPSYVTDNNKIVFTSTIFTNVEKN